MVGTGDCGTGSGSVRTVSALPMVGRAGVVTEQRLGGVEGGGVNIGSGVVYGGGVRT